MSREQSVRRDHLPCANSDNLTYAMRRQPRRGGAGGRAVEVVSGHTSTHLEAKALAATANETMTQPSQAAGLPGRGWAESSALFSKSISGRWEIAPRPQAKACDFLERKKKTRRSHDHATRVVVTVVASWRPRDQLAVCWRPYRVFGRVVAGRMLATTRPRGRDRGSNSVSSFSKQAPRTQTISCVEALLRTTLCRDPEIYL